MIDIKGITKSFGPLQVLKGIDLHIEKGEVVSIVGPSGAGKTTLLQIIGTLDKPDSGEITIDGTDVRKLSSKQLSEFRNKRIGFVFQFHQLLPEFTAVENVMLPALIAGTLKGEAKKAELHQLFFDLRDKTGQTFVIVTHDENLAAITDRTIKMKDGMLETEAAMELTPTPTITDESDQDGKKDVDTDAITAQNDL